MVHFIIGWVRDARGKVLDRPVKAICNAITSMSGGGILERMGLGIPPLM